MRLGLITDTHLPALIRSMDELGPECADVLRGVDLILHAGDVTAPSVLDWLEQFAPVIAACGNNDDFIDRRLLPQQYIEIEGWRIGMTHDLTPETRPMNTLAQTHFPRPVDIMISGHTHLERIRHGHGMVLLNSGSPILPHHKETRLGTLALLDLTPERLHAAVIVLGETPGRPNPGRPLSLDLSRAQLLAHRD